ncbi:MAG: CoA ester lyase [Parvibaculaceae bacterium]
MTLAFTSPRSILFVPADRTDLATKAVGLDCDAVCLDLEDGVAIEAKPAARNNLRRLPDQLSKHKPVLIRVNHDLLTCATDLRSIPEVCSAVVLPKVRSPEHLYLVADALSQIGGNSARRPTPLFAMIEDSRSLHNFATSQMQLPPIVAGIALGAEDLSADLGCDPASEQIHSCFLTLVRIARRCNIDAFGFPGAIGNYQDLDKLNSQVAFSARNGAVGAFCIHPKQIETLNSAFTPSPDDISRAERIIAAFETAREDHKGVVSLEGAMIDKPVYLRAINTIARSKPFHSQNSV